MKNRFRYLLAALLLPGFVAAQSLEEARKLTENEQYDAATNVYQQLISREPANGNLYYFFGDNYLLGDNADSAMIVFEQGRKADAANLLLSIGMAKSLMDRMSVREAKSAAEKDPSNAEAAARYADAQRRVAEAQQLIDDAVAKAPAKSAAVLIEAAEALIHYTNKDLDKAKTLLDRALTIEPKNPEIHLLLGDIYTELNNGTLAADYYNKALDYNKTSARGIVSKGRLYKRSTNYEGAAAEFEQAIQLDPNYAPAYRELGETYFRLGRLEKAKEQYRKYLELSRNNCNARIRYASFLYLSKEYTNALNEINQVKQKCDSGNVTLLRVESYCYFEIKDYQRGLFVCNRLFDKLLEDKRTVTDYEYYGKILIGSGRDSLGVENLRRAYGMDPSRVDLLSELANAYMKMKRYPDAIQVLNEKITLGKDVKVADYFNLGRSYYFNHQFAPADSAMMKVNELSPKFASGYLWRAKANTQIDSTSELGLAKPHYEKYIELAEADSANAAKYNSGLIEAYGYLAYYYILKKDNANALLYLRKKAALPLEPDDKKNVEDAIRQLSK